MERALPASSMLIHIEADQVVELLVIHIEPDRSVIAVIAGIPPRLSHNILRMLEWTFVGTS